MLLCLVPQNVLDFFPKKKIMWLCSFKKHENSSLTNAKYGIAFLSLVSSLSRSSYKKHNTMNQIWKET